MIAVDEGHVDRGQAEFVVAGEEILAGLLVMGDDVLDAEAGEMAAHLVRIAPEIHAADGLGRSVAQQRIGGIDKGQPPGTVVLQAQGQADDAEAVARADDQHVLRPQGPHQAVVDETKSQVQVRGGFAVPQRLGMVEDLLNHRGIKTEGRGGNRGCFAVEEGSHRSDPGEGRYAEILNQFSSPRQTRSGAREGRLLGIH